MELFERHAALRRNLRFMKDHVAAKFLMHGGCTCGGSVVCSTPLGCQLSVRRLAGGSPLPRSKARRATRYLCYVPSHPHLCPRPSYVRMRMAAFSNNKQRLLLFFRHYFDACSSVRESEGASTCKWIASARSVPPYIRVRVRHMQCLYAAPQHAGALVNHHAIVSQSVTSQMIVENHSA